MKICRRGIALSICVLLSSVGWMEAKPSLGIIDSGGVSGGDEGSLSEQVAEATVETLVTSGRFRTKEVLEEGSQNPDESEAIAFLERYSNELAKLFTQHTIKAWNYATNVTEENSALSGQAGGAVS